MNTSLGMARYVRIPAGIAGLALLGLAGCGRGLPQAPRADANPLSPEDFLAEQPRVVGAGSSSPGPTRIVGESTAREHVFDVTSAISTPRPGERDPLPVSEEILVDTNVGEVNGKPIRASTFLAEVGDRLSALARQEGTTRERWREQARGVINSRLSTIIQDELFRAEMLSELTPEQKVGLFSWLESNQRRFVSQHGGSVARASSALSDESKTIQQWRQSEEQRGLIAEYLRRNIITRVQISKADIEAYYTNHPEIFQPPPVAKFRRVSVPLREPEAVEAVRLLLDKNTPFENVARSQHNSYDRAEGGLVTRVVKGDFAQGSYFNTPALNAAARDLTPQAWTGPIEVDGSAEWLFLEEIGDRRRSLYDAQLEIEATLTQQRRQALIDRAVSQLLERANFTARERMGDRLVALAEEMYLGPQRTPAPGPAPTKR